MQISEGSLTFSFSDDYSVVKFDDTIFYRRYFNALPNAKGIDFIADSSNIIMLIEIKNCKGHEAHNRWRTVVNNSKVLPNTDVADDSFDIEIAKKVAMSISCLLGAYTKSKTCKVSEELLSYFKGITDSRIILERKKIKIIFFLEGDFGSSTRTKKMIMKRIQESLQRKLSWLYCNIYVVDSNTINDTYFEVM